MASSSVLLSNSIPSPALCSKNQHCFLFRSGFSSRRTSKNRIALRVQAAKLPAGVETPKVLPKFEPPFLGFTRTAEIWNSRTCMIGLVGIFIVELILNKGILQVIGIDVGKGLDLPLLVNFFIKGNTNRLRSSLCYSLLQQK